MLARFRARLTYANVVATLALFVALGGTSYAALNLTGKDIRNRSITRVDLRKNTLTGTEINESKLRTVPRAARATSSASADISKSADSAVQAQTATNATNASVAAVANDAKALAGQGAQAFEKSSRTSFGKAAAAPAGVSGETAVLSWPELGVEVTSASVPCPVGDLAVAIKNTRSSGPPVRMFQPDNAGSDANEPDVPPGGKAYMCPPGGDETLEAAATDTTGRTLFIHCLAADGELRCLGTRSEP
jgi:hypothetical protein